MSNLLYFMVLQMYESLVSGTGQHSLITSLQFTLFISAGCGGCEARAHLFFCTKKKVNHNI